MNTVITISRQCGCRGHEAGKLLAERLGVPFYDRVLLRQAAVEMGIADLMLEAFGEKHAASVLYNMVLGEHSFGYHDPAREASISQKAPLLAFDIIRRVAKEPCVIVGRCADYALRDRGNIVTVFLHAPLGARVRNVAVREGIPPEAALEAVDETDRLRRNYYNYYTGGSWGDVSGYDLCADTNVLGPQGTAELLADYCARREAAGHRRDNVIELDKIM